MAQWAGFKVLIFTVTKAPCMSHFIFLHKDINVSLWINLCYNETKLYVIKLIIKNATYSKIIVFVKCSVILCAMHFLSLIRLKVTLLRVPRLNDSITLQQCCLPLP